MSQIPGMEEDPESPQSGLDVNPLKLFEFTKSQGRPLYAAAPMVRYSKLAFRQTIAEYGVDLAWTPMILGKEFNRSHSARESDFTTNPAAPPTILQLGVNSPLEIYRTTLLLAPFVNGIDINCGCPQSWACADSLGAALMHKPHLVASMISASRSALTSLGYTIDHTSPGYKTVSVKIRIHRDLSETIEFLRIVQEAGVDFITVHGRTRGMASSVPVDLEAIKLLRGYIHVPMIANGDIFCMEDVKMTTERTGVDGVMAARGLLENPGLFRAPHPKESLAKRSEEAGREVERDNEVRREGCAWDVVETFMRNVVIAPLPFKLVVHHLSEMVGSDHTQRGETLFTKEERKALMACGNMLELIDFLDDIRELKR